MIAEPLDFIGLVTNTSPIGMTALFIFALLRRWLILPRELDMRDERVKELEAERDEYKEMAFRALNVGEYMATQTEGKR